MIVLYLLYLFCALLGLYFTYVFIRHYKATKILCKIHSPLGGALFGGFKILFTDTETLFYKVRALSTENYPIYRISTFYVNIINILDPNDIQTLLSSMRHLSKSKIYSFLNNWLGTGLLTSTGSKWHTRRKILTPAFHFNILQEFLTIFNDESEKLVNELEVECGKEAFDIIPYITQFTLQSIGETAMGLSNIDRKMQQKYKEAIYKIGEIFVKRISTPWLRIQKIYEFSSLGKEEDAVVKVLHEFSSNIIQKRENERRNDQSYSEKKRQAMLDLLLTAKAESGEIDFEGIREEVDTFMFEGHDTTSMALSMLILTLSNHEEIQDKIRDEILKVLGRTKKPDYDDLQKLRYTEMCIKESLRLFPSVPTISRYAGETFQTAGGYTIPKGTVVHVHILDIHRNATLYPDPLKFDPDRFLPENCQSRHPFAYLPFSSGPRNCIGQRFAMLELKSALCGILRKFVLEKAVDMHDIKFKPDLVLRPTSPVEIKLKPLLQ